MSTTTRDANASRGATGRLSRHSAPRPSRHQEFTPNSSAPPEATRPGRIVEHVPVEGRRRARPGRGNSASTTMPRRIGTDRQMPARSVRTRATRSEPRVRRGPGAATTPARSSSRGGRRGDPAGQPGADARRRRRRRDQQRPAADAHGQPAPARRRRARPATTRSGRAAGRAAAVRPVGDDQRDEPRPASTPEAARRRGDAVRAAAYATRRPRPRPGRARCAATSQRQHRQPARRQQRGAGPTAYAVGAEQRPGLQQPGDVERRHQQRAEVVGGRADRERDRLVAREQLAAAAGRGRGDDARCTRTPT